MQMTFRIDNALVIVGFKGTYEELNKIFEEAEYTGYSLMSAMLPTEENSGTNEGFVAIKNELTNVSYHLQIRYISGKICFNNILVLGMGANTLISRKTVGLTASVEDLYLAIQEYKRIVRQPLTSLNGKYVFVVPGNYEAYIEESEFFEKGFQYLLKGAHVPLSINNAMLDTQIENSGLTQPPRAGLMDSTVVRIDKYIMWKFNKRLRDGYKVGVYNTFQEMMADI